MKRSWDIFCSVIDNFGDAGVCWRLARQLSSELGQKVRLWIDDLKVLHCLCADVDPHRSSQHVEGVEIQRWTQSFAEVAVADFVIEGFGVALPDTYLQAMAARAPHVVWINLEYLSAEQWVEGCHGLPSPHPRLPLVKYFFFPGFTPATGGLLYEAGLVRQRDTFQNDVGEQLLFWRGLAVESSNSDATRISLFCYENAALEELIQVWSTQEMPVICVVPEGRVLAQLNSITNRTIRTGQSVRLGKLTVGAIPFLELDDYDKLLWSCDFNFVRGEDSFVRAQFAGRAMMWQAYPQTDRAHLAKVAAFAARYTNALVPPTRLAVSSAFNAWNGEAGDISALWAELYRERQSLSRHAGAWAAQLMTGGNLAEKLAEFCESRLQ